MKQALAVLVLGILLFAAQGCGDEPPQLRIRNDLTESAKVSLIPTVGDRISIQTLNAGEASDYKDVGETHWTADARVPGFGCDEFHTEFTTKNNYRYTVILANTAVAELVVEVEER